MNSDLRSLLVHIDGSPRSDARLALARSLAADLGASVTALYAVESTLVQMPVAMDAGGSAITLLKELDTDRLLRARQRFAEATRDAADAVRWVELGGEPVVPGFVAQALFSDLLVLGQRPAGHGFAHDVPPDFVESVIVGSGVPALVVPREGDVQRVGRRIVVAWKSTRESAHALRAAWPLLRQADQAHLAHWRESEDEPEPLEALEAHVRHHGVTPIMHSLSLGSASLGDALLSFVADQGADLVVMGCYGHSRVREFVLGGASRSLLDAMTVPVLMAH